MNGVNQYYVPMVQEHTWQVNDKKIKIAKVNGEIQYYVSDIYGNTLSSNIIGRNRFSVDDIFEGLKNHHRVILDSNNVPLFRRPIRQWKTETNSNTLSLIKNVNELIWQLSDSSGQVSLQQSFFHSYPSYSADDNTGYLIHLLKHQPIDRIIAHFLSYHDLSVANVFHIKDINYLNELTTDKFNILDINDVCRRTMNVFHFSREYSGSFSENFVFNTNGRDPRRIQDFVKSIFPFCVMLNTKKEMTKLPDINQDAEEPLSEEYCRLPQDVRMEIDILSRSGSPLYVSKYTWLVRGIITDGWCGKHFEVIIEGLNNGYANLIEGGETLQMGEYFMMMAHLTSNFVRIEIVNPEQCKRKIVKKSEAWSKPSILVNKMLDAIMHERTTTWDTEINRNTPQFSIFGNDSIFSFGRHSCCRGEKTR